MKKIEYLPHIADVRMKLTADNIETLFRAGAEGMGHLLKEEYCENREPFTHQERIHIQSHDQTLLLIDFLSEILTFSYIHKAIFCTIEIRELSEKQLEGVIYGSRVDEFDEDIKAVTYTEADIRQNEADDWETMIVFDI